MYQESTSVAFSGYRPQKLRQDAQSSRALRNLLQQEISQRIAEGFNRFLSGMAEGFDCIAAEMVLELKQNHPHIQLVCVLPFAAKRKQDMDYHRILEQADECITLSEATNRNAYFSRNEYLVNHASHLICYYDGLSGGTEHTIGYAEKKGCAITNLAEKMVDSSTTSVGETSLILGSMRDELDRSLKQGGTLSIISHSFSIYAFEALKRRLKNIDQLRFVFTSPLFVADKPNKVNKEFFIPLAQVQREILGSDYEIRLRNALKQKAVARECAQWIQRKATFKSMREIQYGGGQITIQQAEQALAYSPVSDLCKSIVETGAGAVQPAIPTQPILKMSGHQGKALANYFEQCWAQNSQMEEVTQQVIESIENCYKENAPEFIYNLSLYHLFEEFLRNINADTQPNEATGYQKSCIWRQLYNFQADAAQAIISKLEHYNGCILADSVGLGKTFTALAVIKYYENRNKHVLVLCPKKLGPNWNTYTGNYLNNPLREDRLRYDVLYHSDLTRTRGMSNGIDLSRINWGNYDLVVIDESHNFRNGGKLDLEEDERENRYQKLLNQVLKASVQTKVLMLSATPVNNRFSDLKNQLQLAYEGKAEALEEKLPTQSSIEAIFRNAQTAFNRWNDMEPAQRTRQNLLQMLDKDFFQLLDAVTIARSRKQITKHYDTSAVGTFPTRLKPISLQPKLSENPQCPSYNQIVAYLDKLNLSIYSPMQFVLPSYISHYEGKGRGLGFGGDLSQKNREQGLKRIMRINILKRLESSVHSFRLTLERIHKLIDDTIRGIEQYERNQQQSQCTIPYDENLEDGELEDISVSKLQISIAHLDYLSWKRLLQADSTMLRLLLREIHIITPEHDSKLQQLEQLISHKVENPINGDNKKIIIFTAFADTADYLYAQLANKIKHKHQLESALVTGKVEGRSTLAGIPNELNSVLCCFSPCSKQKQLLMPKVQGEIDLLIATDCISEGQNLQDCDYLINYDIHWNPVRIIQRFGRIDRIGSKNECVQMLNFWPDISLDSYIKLKARVENRMQIVDVAATGDDNILNEEEKLELAYRKSQLKRLQEEVVDLEDSGESISIMDLGLNEYRLELLKYKENHPKLAQSPTGLHCLLKAEGSLAGGTIFVLRNRVESINYKKQNLLHPFYLVYMAEDGRVIKGHDSVLDILDLLNRLCKGNSQHDRELCRAFNRETDDGRDMQSISELLTLAIQSIIKRDEEQNITALLAGESIFFNQETQKGLDDFELISFFVLR